MIQFKIGTAGFPHSTIPRNVLQSLHEVKKLGLQAMELEFVHGVWLNEESAKKIFEENKKTNIALSAHAPYYVNLNAKEKYKIDNTKKFITDSLKMASIAGARNVVVHPGFYLKDSKEETLRHIEMHLKELVEELNSLDLKASIALETMGRTAQFGSLEECLILSKECKVNVCFDFSHLFARSIGKANSKEAFNEMIDLINHYNKKLLKDMHIHLSGMNYGDKGEKNHLPLKESPLNFKALIQVLIERKCAGIIICESPNLETDALLIQKTFMKIA